MYGSYTRWDNGNITNFIKILKDLTDNNPNLSKRFESIELTNMTFLLNNKSNYTKRIVMNANNTQNATFSNEIIKIYCNRKIK